MKLTYILRASFWLLGYKIKIYRSCTSFPTREREWLHDWQAVLARTCIKFLDAKLRLEYRMGSFSDSPFAWTVEQTKSFFPPFVINVENFLSPTFLRQDFLRIWFIDLTLLDINCMSSLTMQKSWPGSYSVQVRLWNHGMTGRRSMRKLGYVWFLENIKEKKKK